LPHKGIYLHLTGCPPFSSFTTNCASDISTYSHLKEKSCQREIMLTVSRILWGRATDAHHAQPFPRVIPVSVLLNRPALPGIPNSSDTDAARATKRARISGQRVPCLPPATQPSPALGRTPNSAPPESAWNRRPTKEEAEKMFLAFQPDDGRDPEPFREFVTVKSQYNTRAWRRSN
jgi:hypothetical protein